MSSVFDAGLAKEFRLSVTDANIHKEVLSGHVFDGGVWKEFYSAFTATHLLTVGRGPGASAQYGYVRSFSQGAISPSTLPSGQLIEGLGTNPNFGTSPICLWSTSAAPAGWRPLIGYQGLGNFPIVGEQNSPTQRRYVHSAQDSSVIYNFLVANLQQTIAVSIEGSPPL